MSTAPEQLLVQPIIFGCFNAILVMSYLLFNKFQGKTVMISGAIGFMAIIYLVWTVVQDLITAIVFMLYIWALCDFADDFYDKSLKDQSKKIEALLKTCSIVFMVTTILAILAELLTTFIF